MSSAPTMKVAELDRARPSDAAAADDGNDPEHHDARDQEPCRGHRERRNRLDRDPDPE